MAMTDNKAVAEQFVENFNERDWERQRALFADDYVNHNPPPFPGADAGPDGMIFAMKTFSGAFPDARAEARAILTDGDHVVLHNVIRGRHEGEFLGVEATGKEAKAEFIHIFRVEDGRIAERWGLIDAMSLMQQLGAIPAPRAAVGAAR